MTPSRLPGTYCKKKVAEFKRPSYRLQFQDWDYLKSEWRKFTDVFVNSPVHIVACGRGGYEYDYTEDEDTKKSNSEGSGLSSRPKAKWLKVATLLILEQGNLP
jgi:hypothetical protein